MDHLKIVEKVLRETKGANEKRFFADKSQEVKVTLLKDSSISPAKFKKHPFLVHHFYAHPDTIRALRSDLFLLGGDFIDLEKPFQCLSCKFDLDLQFWLKCPRCGAELDSHIK